MSSLTPESDILKPLSPVHLHEKYESSWPIFLLRNAIVTDKAGNVVSLITATDQNLLVVSGELVQKKDQAIHYVSGALKRKTVYLEINPVGRFAFGINEDDEEEIWAAGKSGWFQLEPATNYDAVYNEMREGCRLWYSIVDSPKLQNATSKDISIPYMKKKDLKGRTAEDVFRQHAGFIIQQMNKSLAAWSKKPLYQYLQKLKKEKSRAIEPAPTRLKPPPMTNTTQAREVKKRGRPARVNAPEPMKTPQHRRTKIQTPVDELRRVETDAAILWKFLQRFGHSKASDTEKLDFDKIAQLVHGVYIFDDVKQAGNYLRFQSKYLLRGMSERRQAKIWKDTPFYHDLMASKLSQAMTGKMAKIVLQVQMIGDMRPAERMGKDGLDFYMSSDEEILPRHQKSALRPKSGGKGKSYTARNGAEEDNVSTDSMTPRKRKTKDDNIGQRRSKRRALSITQSSDHSSPAKTEFEESIEIETVSQAGDTSLPLRWKNAKKTAELNENAPVLFRGATLNAEPNAPGDVWRCTALGCMRSVYGASGKLGKRLVDEHMQEHEEQDAPPEIDIILSETKKTNLPVSALIKRIREFAAAQELAEAMAAADKKTSRETEDEYL